LPEDNQDMGIAKSNSRNAFKFFQQSGVTRKTNREKRRPEKSVIKNYN